MDDRAVLRVAEHDRRATRVDHALRRLEHRFLLLFFTEAVQDQGEEGGHGATTRRHSPRVALLRQL